jgi:hypothetical protein
MRRLARHILTVCAAASLGGCLIVMVLWLRTGAGALEMEWAGLRGEHYHRARFVCAFGNVRAEWVLLHKEWAGDAEHSGFHLDLTDAPRASRFWSREFEASHVVGRPGEIRAAQVPHWFAVLICLPFPLAVFGSRLLRRRRLRRQRLTGRCQSCGYDLRESPDRCPECGTTAVLMEKS